MPGTLGRRELLTRALALGAAAALPRELVAGTRAAVNRRPALLPPSGLFLKDEGGLPRRSTCEAMCARIVPTGGDPGSSPGAVEAGAIQFIDIFLSAFDLPGRLADHPAIYLEGRFSGRYPYPDNQRGTPSRNFPPDDFIGAGGARHFLDLTPLQELSWRVQLYGRGALDSARVSKRWAAQVGALIPLPQEIGLRQVYQRGLDGFEDLAQSMFGVSLAEAGSVDQDQVLAVAAGGATSKAPASPASLAAAQQLFPQLVTHTLQACYSLPEYGGNRNGLMWRFIGWDGDTQPLGNSIYDSSLAGPGRGANQGFGDPAVYQPRGGYRQHRAVSGPEL
ncbi:MAG: gluconate 2-dehydrogenase subunit 3 family protein [Nitrososphaerales archaeon]